MTESGLKKIEGQMGKIKMEHSKLKMDLANRNQLK